MVEEAAVASIGYFPVEGNNKILILFFCNDIPGTIAAESERR